MPLCFFDLFSLRIICDLIENQIYLLLFQIDDIIHQSLRLSCVVAELLEVERGLLRKWIFYIIIQIDGQQSATIIGAKRNLSTRIRAHRAETKVGIAVGDTFAYDCVPEKYTRFRALPCVVNYLLPKCLRLYFFDHLRVVAIDGVLLLVFLSCNSGFHKSIINFHTDICARDFTLLSFRIDKGLTIGVLDADGQHQCSASAVLRHFARRVAEAFHKRNNTR